jgi:hypothetical protein
LVTNGTVPTFDELTEGLARLCEEAPYDHFCFWARLPGLTHEQALESMRLLPPRLLPGFATR